ncbi:biotinidase-like [Portunus trituberculatus]|uniref:biotinidase-like n=1 Tax=Portunus trituberculatus TaxID=210409 RepID=UPI001E1D2171|nr:biotinidase-like [Portunus trituberculatus]
MLCVRLLLLVAVVGTDEVQYTGAVLEHEPYSSWEAGGTAILQENARIFLEHAALAKQQGADIIVFPEYGLTSNNLEGGDVLSLAQVVPHPADQVVLCLLNKTSSHTQVLRELSCGAAQLKLYLIVDLIELVHCSPNQILDCPDVGYYLYNTQVVLDRCGTLVARYRKKHLFLEAGITAGDESDATAVFTTDFGVTFTLQICFDILYESPGVANVEGGVRDVVMSTAWMDELPFLTAPQMFRGWSAGLGVNLLVANYHNTRKGMQGSGLFPGASGQLSSYTYDHHHSGSTLLVASLATNTSTGHSTRVSRSRKDLFEGGEQHRGAQQKPQPQEMVFKHEDLSRYNHLLLEEAASPITASLCHNDGLCCSVTYTFLGNTSTTEHYMLLAYSGLVEKGGGVYSMYTQVCSVVFCLSDEVNSCARVEGEDPPLASSFLLQEVSGMFEDLHVFPSVMSRDLTLVSEQLWNFDSIPLSSSNQQEAIIHVKKETDPLLSATLMGRWYQRDLVYHSGLR